MKMTSYLFLACITTWSCVLIWCTTAETLNKTIECDQPVIVLCQCGHSRIYQDIYVSRCEVKTADNSPRCEICPGSCSPYMFCKTCSKDGCLSCPDGRWGQFCENVKNFKANNTNLTEAPEEKMKSFTHGITVVPTNLNSFSPNTPDNISIVNLPSEKSPEDKKLKNKFVKNKNYRNTNAGTTVDVTNGNAVKSNSENDMESKHYVDVFDSNVNPEISYSLLNKTEKFTSKQKEMLTVLHDSLKHKDEVLPMTIQDEADIMVGDLRNDSLIYRSDSINSSLIDFLNYSTENVDSSKNKGDSFSENSNGYSYENLNESSPSRNLPSVFAEIANIEANVSSSSQKFSFPSPELHDVEEKKYEMNKTEDLPSEQKGRTEKGQTFFEKDLQEAKFLYPLISYRKISFNFSEPGNKSTQGNNHNKNSEINPMEYRSAFVLDSKDFKKGNIKQKLSNKQSDELKMVTKLPEIQNPLNISTFKVKIIDLGENVQSEDAEYRNSSKENIKVDKMIKFSEISKDRLFENNSKEFEVLKSPLEVNIFKITFIGEESDRPFQKQNSNLTEIRMTENGEKTNASLTSQSNTSELSESIAIDSEIAAPLNGSVSKIIWGENVSLTSEETRQKNTVKSADDDRRKIKKERKANYKRNATNKPFDEFQYDVDALLRMIMQPSERSKLGKSNDAQLHNSNSFSKYNIPENHILMPLYFPEMYNTELYQDRLSNNIDLQKLCDLYPNYGPCFLVRMLAPRSPYVDIFGSHSKHHYQKSSQNGRYIHHYPQLIYYDSEGNVNTRSNAEKAQNYLRDMRTLALLKKYLQSKNAQTVSSLPLKNSQQFDTIAEEEESFQSLVYGWDKENQPKQRSDSKLFSGLINHFLSLIAPKYNGNEVTQIGILRQPEWYNNKPAPSFAASQVMDLPLNVYQHGPLTGTYGQGYNNPYRYFKTQEDNTEYFNTRMLNDRERTHFTDTDMDLEPNKPKYESIRIFLNIPSGLEYLGVLPLTQNRELLKHETPEEVLQKRKISESNHTFNEVEVCDPKKSDCKMPRSTEESFDYILNDTITSRILPETADSIQIQVLHPMFGQFSFKNETNIRDVNSLESAEDALFESCARCVISESVYQPVDGGEKPGKSLPTIFRTLIVEEEGLLFGNESDAEKPNKSRSKRAIYVYGTHEWCPIERGMLNGDLDCTIWSYQKACTLICHPGYTCEYQTFRCLRKTNTWTPAIRSCKPIIQYNSFTYRHGNDSLSEFLYLPEGNNMGNRNDSSTNSSSLFGAMERSDRAEIPDHSNYEPAADERKYDGGHNFRNVDKKLLSEDEASDAERMFDMYEQMKPIKKNSSDKRHKYAQQKPAVGKNNQQTDKIYNILDKGNPETGNVDMW